jgi:large subunit ribosomal protein L5
MKAAIPRFESFNNNIILPDIVRKQSVTNPYQLPKLNSILLHVHSKNAAKDLKELKKIYNVLSFISGVEPTLVTAKKSIAQFKVRKGAFVGCKVSLTQSRMMFFLDYLASTVFDAYIDADKIPITLPYENSIRKIGKFKRTYAFGIKNILEFSQLESHSLWLKNINGVDISLCFSQSSNQSLMHFLTRSSILPINFIANKN